MFRPVLFTVLAWLGTATWLHAQDPVIDVQAVFQTAARKALAHDARHPQYDAFPDEARGPVWKTVNRHDWVSGFYPGSLWYITEYARRNHWSDAATWEQRARAWTQPLHALQDDTSTHDLGFMVFDSVGHDYRLTQDSAAKEVLLRSAASLAERFVPSAQIIRSWGQIGDSKAIIIIDNMMNLELLWWASEHGGTTRGGTSADLKHVAITHADHVLNEFFRPDGSTYHRVDLDAASGTVQRKTTAQGKGPETCWSRGQTWAIYGFAYMAEVTGEARFLAASLKAADYYIAHLPADLIPPSDFNSTLTGLEFQDSSAAPVAASAFYRLARLVEKGDPARAEQLRSLADRTLVNLTRAPYFAPGDDQASLLVYGARNYHPDPKNRLTNISLIWGDYYLLEALLQYDARQRAR